MPNRFLNNITINDQYTFPSTDGSADQVIKTDGAGNLSFTDIVATETDKALSLTLRVKNTESVALTKGQVVCAAPTATPPSGNVIEVKLADNNGTDSMPAIGILNEGLDAAGGANDEGEAIMFGRISGIDTSAFSVGDEVFVSDTAGALTATKPTGVKYIQKVGVIMRDDASNGTIEVFGAGRTNDVPTPLYIDHANQRVGIGVESPATALEIQGYSGNIKLGNASNYNGISLNGTLDIANYNFLSRASDKTLYINRPLNKDIEFRENNSTQVIIKSSGNVGIGTTSPAHTLSINGTVSSNFFRGYTYPDNSFLDFDKDDTAASNYTALASIGRIAYLADTNTNEPAANAAHEFFTGTSDIDTATSLMIIQTDGNVGIGTNSPDALLDIGTNNIITLDDTGSSTGFIGMGSYNDGTKNRAQGASYYGFGLEIDRPNQLISFNSYDSNGITTSGTGILALKRDGNVGIGTTSPSYKFVVQDTVSSNTHAWSISPHAAGIDLHSTGNIAPHYQTNFTLYTGNIGSGTQRFQVDSSGNVTVSGDLTVSGGDITLSGTGRIQGIDTVSAGTDAANKTYVDNYAYSQAASDTRYVNVTGDTMSGPLTINIADDPKIILQTSAGDSSDWNYINFVGRDAVRDAYVGTDADGDLNMYSVKNSYGIFMNTTGVYINADARFNDRVRIGDVSGLANRGAVRIDTRGDAPADLLFGRDTAGTATGWNGVYWSISSRASTDSNQFRIYRGVAHTSPYNSEAIPLAINPNLSVNLASSISATQFYDSDNTSYYGNFAGNSRYNTAQGNYLGLGTAANTSGSYRLNMGGSIDMNANNIDYVSQLHFNDNVRFYDEGNDSYLNFKYGDSTTGGIKFYNGGTTLKGYIYANDAGFGLLDNDGHWALRSPVGGSGLELRSNNNVEFTVNDDHTLSHGSSRAPIFYDSDNTGYYLNPYGQSKIRNNDAQEALIIEGDYPQLTIRKTNIPDASIHFDAGYAKKFNIGPGAGGAEEDEFGFAVYSGPRGTHYGTFLRISAETGFVQVGDKDHPSYPLDVLGTAYSSADFRAPIFYDSNDTNYYLNPASTTNLNSLLVQGTTNIGHHRAYKFITVDGDANTYYPVVIGGSSGYGFHTYSVSRRYNDPAPNTWNTSTHRGGLTFTFKWSGDTAWGGNHKPLRVIEFGETYSNMLGGFALARTGGVVVWLRGGTARYTIHAPNGSDVNATVYLSGFTDGAGTNYGTRTTRVTSEWEDRWPIQGDNSTSSVDTSYAGSFYDRNDTNYFVDPNNTSRSARLRGEIFIGANTSSQFLRIGGNGGAIDHSTVSTSNGNLHINSKNGSHTYLNHYSNGNTYLNNGGGFTYSYTSMRAPIFYDSNDTNYYLDPASTTTSAALAGRITIGQLNTASDGDNWNIKLIENSGSCYVANHNGTAQIAAGGVQRATSGTGIKLDADRNCYAAVWADAPSSGVPRVFLVTAASSTYGATPDYEIGLTLLGDGLNYVGIGTTSPAARLDVRGTAGDGSELVRIESDGDVSNGGYQWMTSAMASSQTTDANMIHLIGVEEDLKNSGYFGFHYAGDNSNDNYIKLGGYAADDLMVIKMNGNVGIGTTSPNAKLQVGDTQTTQATGISLCAGSSVGNIIARTTTHHNWLPYIDGSNYYSADNHIFRNASHSTEWMRINSSGNVGIGTTSPFTTGGTAKLTIASNSAISWGASNTDMSYFRRVAAGEFQWQTYFSGNTGEIHLQPYGGNVGIGTANTYAKLSVRAVSHNTGISVNRANDTTAAIYIGNDGGSNPILAANNADMLFGRDVSGTFTEYARIKNGGNVGIGTTSPSAKLQVSNNGTGNTASFTSEAHGANQYSGITINSRTESGVDWYGSEIRNINTAGTPSFLNPRLGFFTQDNNTYLPAGRSEKMSILGNGYVGIGDTTPSYKLDVNGTIRATGDVIAYSDIRVKENITTIENALDKVKKLRGVEYNKIDNPERSIGVIAQEIEEVIPEVVKEDSEGMKSVAYGNITAVLIEAIKEQQKQIEELKSIINGSSK